MDRNKFKLGIYMNMAFSIISSAAIVLIFLSSMLFGTYVVSSKAYYAFINLYNKSRIFMECYMVGSVVLFFIIMFIIMNFRMNKLLDRVQFKDDNL